MQIYYFLLFCVDFFQFLFCCLCSSMFIYVFPPTLWTLKLVVIALLFLAFQFLWAFYLYNIKPPILSSFDKWIFRICIPFSQKWAWQLFPWYGAKPLVWLNAYNKQNKGHICDVQSITIYISKRQDRNTFYRLYQYQ